MRVPASYGNLIASRYRDCPSPLTTDFFTTFSSEGHNGVSQTKLEYIAESVSLSREFHDGSVDIYGRPVEVQKCSGHEAYVDTLLAANFNPCPRRKFSVVITHDVDRTTFFEFTTIAKLVARLRPWTIMRSIKTLNAYRSAIARTIDELLQFENEKRIRSIFFFLSGPYSLSRYGSRASLGWTSAKRIIQAVRDAEMEIGLHGSYYAMDLNSYKDECRLLSDVKNELYTIGTIICVTI